MFTIVNSRMKYQLYPFGFFVVMLMVLITGCLETTDINSLEPGGIDAEYAIPLIDSKIGIKDLIEDEDSNASLIINPDGTVTAFYSGDITRQGAFEVFPPVLGIQPFPLTDTFTTVEVPFEVNFRTQRAIYKGTALTLILASTFDQVVSVVFELPQVHRNNTTFKKTFVINPSANGRTEFVSEPWDLTDWEFIGDVKKIDVRYDARLPNGDRVKLSDGSVSVNFLYFSYLELYFDSRILDIQDEIIAVSLLDAWRSGGIEFDDPKIKLVVENSFGFPVRSKVNELNIIALSGQSIPLESVFVSEGINFGFPDLDHVGDVVTTEFVFDKNNSNLGVIFNQKSARIYYDIDAQAFPDSDPSQIGFIDEDSYFLISVAVELPLIGKVNDLVYYQETALDGHDFDDAKSAEIKLLLDNEFPVDLNLQMYFLDDNKNILDSLFHDSRLAIPSAVKGSNDQYQSVGQSTYFIDLSESQMTNLQNTTSIGIETKIDSQEANEVIEIRAEYNMNIKMGAKVKVEK